jgi:predicted Zn-dependent protease
MLFDLRSRGRRRTVQGVYLGLALLMGGGLVLFGVGAGNGFGGLLNAFNGNGSGSNQGQVVSSFEKTALAAVKASPTSASAWASLMQARWTAATSNGTGFNQTTGNFTATGTNQLRQLGQDWQRYLQLTKTPTADNAILAAKAYGILGQYGSAADAWDSVSIASPSDVSAYECLAVTSYAAGQTRKGDLATAKSLSLLPKASQATIKLQLNQAKSSSSTAQQIVRASCAA